MKILSKSEIKDPFLKLANKKQKKVLSSSEIKKVEAQEENQHEGFSDEFHERLKKSISAAHRTLAAFFGGI